MDSINDALGPREGLHDTLTGSFWQGCAEGELRVQQCGECETKFFTPLTACPSCLSRNWRWVRSPGTGTVYSYSVVEHIPGGGRPLPYVLIVVDLDDGWTITSNLVDCDPSDARCGMRVSVRFGLDPQGNAIPLFAPK